MSFAFSIQVQVDGTVHETGGFGNSREAAQAAHTEAVHFGATTSSPTRIRQALDAGQTVIVVHADNPRITVRANDSQV